MNTGQHAGAPRSDMMISKDDKVMSEELVSDVVVALHVSSKATTGKQHALAQRRSKFFRPRRRQQMEQLLGTKNLPPRPTASSRAAPPPLLQGITRKRWSFRSRNRAPSPSPSPEASSTSTVVSSSLSTSPSSFLPTSDVHGGRLEPLGSSQMPLLVHNHVGRPKSDSDLAPARSSSQVPLLISRSYAPSSLPQPSPRRVFQLSAMCTPTGTPPLPPNRPTVAAPSSSYAPSPRTFAATAPHDVLSVSEAHDLLPRLTLLRSRHMRKSSSRHRRASSSSCDSANAAPRKPMSRVDAFNSSRLSPASSAVAVPTAPFFELEDVTPDSQCGALRNWLAQPDEMSMDLRRGGATGPLGSTSGLTGALTGALHGVLHLSHTPPSCCSTQCASSLAVSPLRSNPPRRAPPTLSSLNSSMMSSAAAGEDSALQAALTRSMTPRECGRGCTRLDAHLDTITQEVTVESSSGADTPAHSSEDLDELSDASESTMALDTAMLPSVLPSVLPSCSVVGAAQRLLHDSAAMSVRGQGSLASGTLAAGAAGGTPRAAAAAEGLVTAETPSSGCLSDESGETPHSTPAPPSPWVKAAPSDARSCNAAVLHQPSQLLSAQHDSCFDTVGSHPGAPLLWDTADAAPGLECASEKHISDSTIVSYIDGTSRDGSPELLSCSDDTTVSTGSKCSSKGKRAKWVSYLLCSCKAD